MFKHHNTTPNDCRCLLPWDCNCRHDLLEYLSPQLKTAAYALEDRVTICEEQLLEEVRKLAVTNTSCVTMTPTGEVLAKETITRHSLLRRPTPGRGWSRPPREQGH